MCVSHTPGVGNGLQNGRISLLDFRFADDDSTLAHTKYVAKCFKKPLVETCRGVGGKMKDEKWKTNNHMGFAHTNVLPMEMFAKMGGKQHCLHLALYLDSAYARPEQNKRGPRTHLGIPSFSFAQRKTLPKSPDRTCQTTRRVS